MDQPGDDHLGTALAQTLPPAPPPLPLSLQQQHLSLTTTLSPLDIPEVMANIFGWLDDETINRAVVLDFLSSAPLLHRLQVANWLPYLSRPKRSDFARLLQLVQTRCLHLQIFHFSYQGQHTIHNIPEDMNAVLMFWPRMPELMISTPHFTPEFVQSLSVRNDDVLTTLEIVGEDCSAHTKAEDQNRVQGQDQDKVKFMDKAGGNKQEEEAYGHVEVYSPSTSHSRTWTTTHRPHGSYLDTSLVYAHAYESSRSVDQRV
ncbi:hypothetical protein BGW39_010648 [Mortierella sp. 14UC]|nr:hypothetical protein BGW39_010648 [Mortierella sp. 14UC]